MNTTPKYSNLLKLLIVIVGIQQFGCSNPLGDGQGTYIQHGHLPGVPPTLTETTVSPAAGMELVPQANTYTLTSGGSFKVSSSVSNSVSGVVQTSLSGRYKMYSTVQGQIISEESGL